MSKLLYTDSEWSPKLIGDALAACEEIATTELGQKLRPNQVEIISADQMLEAYTSVGMPLGYSHWSKGKNFVQQKHNYSKGHSGLAYEIVINSNPVIALFMEQNTMTMQTLVAAHACCGHNYVFNNNYLFKKWADPDSIIDYLLFAKHYVQQCEEKYGIDEVEATLDAAHALQGVSFDRYKRPPKPNAELQRQRELRLLEAKERERNPFVDLLPVKESSQTKAGDDEDILPEPEENLLYFIEKHAPRMKTWQRELVRIVRIIGQYFYPQRQTQTINEGCATFTHHYIMNRLYEKGMISEGNLLEFITSHSGVIYQPTPDKHYYSGINPYALGFAMFQDIRRICEKPTSEDREWFPDLVDTDWRAAVRFAVENFRDETFISQYLSPSLIREWRMFHIGDKDESFFAVKNIHNDAGYRALREQLSAQYRIEHHTPTIYVTGAQFKSDRTLLVEHRTENGTLLDRKTARETTMHLRYLWGFPVNVTTVDPDGKVLQTYDSI